MLARVLKFAEARPITVYQLFIRREGDELELEIHCSKAPASGRLSMI